MRSSLILFSLSLALSLCASILQDQLGWFGGLLEAAAAERKAAEKAEKVAAEERKAAAEGPSEEVRDAPASAREKTPQTPQPPPPTR